MKSLTTKSESNCAVATIQADEETASPKPAAINSKRRHVIRIIAVTGDAKEPTYTVPVRVSADKVEITAGSVVSSSPHQSGHTATISTASANSGTPEQPSCAHGTVAVAEVMAEGGPSKALTAG